MTITPLKWDSDFFDLKVGLLEECAVDSRDTQKFNRFDLIYQITQNSCQFDIQKFTHSFSQTKLVFRKENIPNSIDVSKEVHNIHETDIKVENLYEIAYESGKYSRFNLDPNFNDSMFKSLYRKWINAAFQKDFADGFLIVKELGKIAGLITYSEIAHSIKIGLFAVHPKYQGRGIGKKLLQAVENIVRDKNYSSLLIPTQGENKRACNFYTSNGYLIFEKKYIKHHWRL